MRAAHTQLDITPEQQSCSSWQRAYAAGLFDGEGCISISRFLKSNGHHRYSLTASVHMADREAIEWLQETWGGRIYPAGQGDAKNKPTFIWRLCDSWAIAFLHDIFPYVRLSKVRAKAHLAVEFQGQKQRLGRYTPQSYRDRQRHYFERMRELNLRGPQAEARVAARAPNAETQSPPPHMEMESCDSA